jgi:hypothetical protein
MSRSLAWILALLWVGLVFWPRPLVIVGDGGDYLAMTIAWGETGLPWVNHTAARAYERYFQKGQAGRSWEALAGPLIRLRDTRGGQDFAHFWFYSLLASGPYRLLALLQINPYYAFLILHLILAAGAARIGHFFYGWKGVGAFFLLLLGSPFLWFSHKIHTEFFTFCCITVFGVLIANRRRVEAATALAAAATQNPPFALLAVVLCFWEVVSKQGRFWQAPGFRRLAACVLLLSLHPLYYLWRYGVLTPQIYLGDSKFSNASGEIILGRLIDLNVGLLPNWPLGLLLLGIGAGMAIRSARRHREALIFGLLFVCLCLWAGSLNFNCNSGGTVHVARYATWLVGLFYPVVVGVWGSPFWERQHSKSGLLLGSLGVLALGFNFNVFWPGRPETYTRPSPVAEWVSAHFPRTYHPIPEIFMERYVFRAELLLPGWIGGVSNARQFLIFPAQIPAHLEGLDLVPGVQGRVDLGCLGKYLKREFQRDPGLRRKPWMYLDLEADEASRLIVLPELESGQKILAGQSPEFFNTGWNQQEDWGRWSAGPDAELAFQWKGSSAETLQAEFSVFQLKASDKTSVKLELNGQILWQNTYPGPEMGPYKVSIPVPASLLEPGRENRLRIFSSPPRSPSAYGSSDSRILGVGLISVQFTPKSR